MVLTGGVRKSGDRLRVTRPSRRQRRPPPTSGRSRSTRRSTTSSPRRRRSPRPSSRSSSRGCSTPASRRGSRRPAENLAARNLYLQGRYHLNQRTDEGLHKALDFFEKAIVEDAQFALAHSGLADAHSLLAHYGVRAAGAGVGEGGVERRVRGDARRQLRRGAHLAGARQGDAGLGLARAPSASSSARSSSTRATRRRTTGTRCRASCRWAASTRRSRRCALAQSLDPVSSIVARDLAVDPRLPPRLRSGARAVRPHHRAESALLAGLLDARPDPGTAEGSRRGDRGVPARHRSLAAEPAHARRRWRARWRCRASGSWRSTVAAQARGDREAALRLAVRVRRRSGSRSARPTRLPRG